MDFLIRDDKIPERKLVISVSVAELGRRWFALEKETVESVVFIVWIDAWLWRARTEFE